MTRLMVRALVLAVLCLPLLAQEAAVYKPLVVLFRTPECDRCDELERVTLAHPAIARRLPAFAFEVRTAEPGTDPGLALFDRDGILRVRWPMVPDTTSFGIILDSIASVAPHFERGGDVEIGIALARLGHVTDARALLDRASARPETREAAATALAALEPKDAADAPRTTRVLRILPLGVQIVTGRHTIRTHVTSASVARVTFSIDGGKPRTVTRPPFSMTHDFGEVPERRAIRAVAFDVKGRELARDERVVNDAGETFWLRIVEPRNGAAAGAVRVTMNARVPPQRTVERVTLTWNDALRAVLLSAPWNADVPIPDDQTGVLRAVAELDDGRTTEDAVLLNARGAFEESNVQLVQLPITVLARDGSDPRITADRITVREGDEIRPVESIATADETPLTIGLLLDTSASMQKTLPDLQEAAIRFLETMMTDRDRAFLVAFESSARLLQPATPDVARLRMKIMSLRPEGLTSLNDAMILGLLQFEGTKGRRAMIVFSDGVDRTSRHGVDDVAELARRANVPIHVISSRHWMSGPPIVRGVGGAGGRWVGDELDRDLKRLGSATGGTAHTLAALSDLPEVYARIDAALRAQILAFIRTEGAKRELEWRRIEVRVSGTDVDLRAPEGYYPLP